MIDEVKLQEIKARIKNKHQGGVNNSRGCDYETFFETYRIVTLLGDWYNNNVDADFQAQKKCLIDDFWVRENDINYYYQLKNVQNLSWTYDLIQDFSIQAELCKGDHEQFVLTIVYSNPESGIVNVPECIKKETTTKYFPYADHINGLIIACDEFRNALQEICSETKASNDILSDIASAVLAEWCKGKKNELCKTSTFYDSIAKPKYVKLKGAPAISISDGIKMLFEKYDIEYSVSSKMLNWSWNEGMMSGSILWNKDKEKRLLSEDYSDVISLINNLI